MIEFNCACQFKYIYDKFYSFNLKTFIFTFNNLNSPRKDEIKVFILIMHVNRIPFNFLLTQRY